MTDKYKSPFITWENCFSWALWFFWACLEAWKINQGEVDFSYHEYRPLYVSPAHPSPTCARHFVPGPSSCCDERTVCIFSQQLPKEADLVLAGNSTQVKAKLKEA